MRTTGRILNEEINLAKAINADYKPTLTDISNIRKTFDETLGKSSKYIGDIPYYINPTFAGSKAVGGADANMIIGDTIWKIKSTAITKPLILDDILQQIGDILLDYNNFYSIKNISFYYTRQKSLITVPVSKLISDSNLLKLKRKSQQFTNNKE